MNVQVSTGSRAAHLKRQIFSTDEEFVYAVLDGAAVPGLLRKLREATEEHACLYRGELKPDLAQVAPYLVKLRQDSPFTDWILTEGWGHHWGIFAIAPVGLEVLRRHFRRFLRVKDPKGKILYFRYYDPRVLTVYLPTCNAEETKTVFGPVKSYVCEDENGRTVSFYRREGEGAKKERIPLTAPVQI